MHLVRTALCAAAFTVLPTATNAQGKGGGARPFAGPSAGVPAPLGTRVPVNFNNHYYRHGYGYGYGYGGVAVGIGVGIGPDGVSDPVAFVGPGYPFGYWQNYNGFYGNGFSMYGPPVPTYAPVPGVYGGSDQRFLGNNPGPFHPTPITSGEAKLRDVMPINPGGPPIIAVPLLSIPPTPIDAVTGPIIPLDPLRVQGTEPAALPVRAKLQMDIIVPANAQVYFDGAETKQVGTVRSYVSTEKNLGEPTEYSVRVDWVERGVPMSKSRKLTGKAGERISVDFTRE